MVSSSSSNRNSTGVQFSNGGANFVCYCGDRMNVRTSWTKANPGRRFLSCPNYGSSKKCNMFQFVDDELPNQYYKELVYQLHLQASRFGNENQFQDHEDTQNELLKIMEDLSITKSKIKVYDRLLMCLVIVVMCLVVAIAAIVV
ncbi:hypothetical protein OSB04_015415 [Centaurea solstitialis]|uniref:GRF-type domain-containing protein n=1 Tax=Centaurea solstitialis TaxID=347529 RepID=A0AA38S630_9ASTR|nr:hypothetical protein OSB04_030032 [Centaurea solstitialis]KAJ9551370.1 hypothetical protein OSB04_015415 [Centaurea solstitialis]